MANNVTMSFANIVKIKGYYLFHGNILKIKKLRFGKEIDFPTKTAITTIQKKLRENGSAPAAIETNMNSTRSFFKARNSNEVNSSVTTDEFGSVLNHSIYMADNYHIVILNHIGAKLEEHTDRFL